MFSSPIASRRASASQVARAGLVVMTRSPPTLVTDGAGGHFGFEFFCRPQFAFFLEVGGQGGTVLPGATVQAGLMFYPWTR